MLYLGSINPGTSANIGRMTTSWATLGRSISSRLREMILDLCSALTRQIWSDGSRSGLRAQEKQGHTGTNPAKGYKHDKEIGVPAV